jgi:hypothetical protein
MYVRNTNLQIVMNKYKSSLHAFCIRKYNISFSLLPDTNSVVSPLKWLILAKTNSKN